MGFVSFKQGHCHGYGHSGCGVCVSSEAADAIGQLMSLKDPVWATEELYAQHPLGGQPGWRAFVISENRFACWNMAENKWQLI